MTDVNSAFRDLLNRARDGDPHALDELVSEYESDLERVVKARLGNALRPYFDSVDLVQSVHKSVLFGLRNDKFDIQSPQHLVRLAAMIVRRKIARYWKRHRRQQRIESKSMDSCDNVSLCSLVLDASAMNARPDQDVELGERLNRVMEQLEPIERQLIELRLEGFNTAEAARHIGIDADVLRARLGRVRTRLKKSGIAADWI